MAAAVLVNSDAPKSIMLRAGEAKGLTTTTRVCTEEVVTLTLLLLPPPTLDIMIRIILTTTTRLCIRTIIIILTTPLHPPHLPVAVLMLNLITRPTWTMHHTARMLITDLNLPIIYHINTNNKPFTDNTQSVRRRQRVDRKLPMATTNRRSLGRIRHPS